MQNNQQLDFDIDAVFKRYEQPIKSQLLRRYIFQIKEYKCECCGNTEWLNQPINLEVHHIDGDKTNNTLENLQLLCPNCHSYTENYGSKKIKGRKIISDEDFIQALKNNETIRKALLSLGLTDEGANYTRARNLIIKYNISLKPKIIKPKEYNKCLYCGQSTLNKKYCSCECAQKDSRVTERPSREELKKLIREKPFVQIGKQFGVTDKAIIKWCITENLPSKKRDINNISDEDWLNI